MKKIINKILLIFLFVICLTGCESEEERMQKEIENKGAVESSALAYIDAVEKQYMLSQIDSQSIRIESGSYTVKQLSNLNVEVQGKKPYSSSIVVISDIGSVKEAWLEFDEYDVYYDGFRAKATTKKYAAHDEKNEEKSLEQIEHDNLLLCQTEMNNVLSAARSYGADNVFTLPSEDGESLTITLGDLITGGYIEGKIENPITKKIINADSEIYITKTGKKWTYELSDNFRCNLD